MLRFIYSQRTLYKNKFYYLIYELKIFDNKLKMDEELLEDRSPTYERHNVDEMLEKAGNNHRYQGMMFLVCFLGWFLAAFIQMGFPIIFHPAEFVCPEGSECSKQEACDHNYPLSDRVKSVAYTFNLACDRERYLNICFAAFLYGGFIGSLYYGQIIERRGRRYAFIEAIAMMAGGIYFSLISPNVIFFSIGVFFFNAGFRGFYNVSLLSLTEVMNELSRAATPMALSIGWALGQITIALIALFMTNWKSIFLLTAIPLTVLLYQAYRQVKQSPRFLVIKHEFERAKQIIQQIAIQNGRSFSRCEMVEQISYKQKMQAYKQIVGESEITSRLKHHSYLSLFKYNSIRIRVLIVGAIWSVFSLSYFISANSKINPDRSLPFNIALAGVIEILAYLISILTSLNFNRVFFIRRLLLLSGALHLCFYFVFPGQDYQGVGLFLVMMLDIGVRVLVSVGNTFLAIYALELFPTSIRHFSLGLLGFVTKLMYWLSDYFYEFWIMRLIHPNFIIGGLFIATYFITHKLRETRRQRLKDNLSEDGDGTMMEEMRVDMV